MHIPCPVSGVVVSFHLFCPVLTISLQSCVAWLKEGPHTTPHWLVVQCHVRVLEDIVLQQLATAAKRYTSNVTLNVHTNAWWNALNYKFKISFLNNNTWIHIL